MERIEIEISGYEILNTNWGNTLTLPPALLRALLDHFPSLEVRPHYSRESKEPRVILSVEIEEDGPKYPEATEGYGSVSVTAGYLHTVIEDMRKKRQYGVDFPPEFEDALTEFLATPVMEQGLVGHLERKRDTDACMTWEREKREWLRCEVERVMKDNAPEER